VLKLRVQGKFQHYLLISLFLFLSSCVFTADENVPDTGCLDGNCKDGFGREVKKISGLIFSNISTAVYEEYSGSFKNKKRNGQGTLKEFTIEFDAAASGWDSPSGSCVYGCVYYQRETYLFVGNFIDEKKNGYGKIRINDTRIFNQAQEPFPFNERRETPHYTIIEGEWKDDILISNNISIKGIKKEQTEKYLFN
jgi:hypothetical protein